MTEIRQLALPLAHRAAMGAGDFLVSDSNRAAFDAVMGAVSGATAGATGKGTTTEIAARLAVTGPAGAGKTHLARIWTARHAGVRVAAAELTEGRVAALLVAPAVAVEDVDRIADLPGPAARQAEHALFHLMNATAAERTPLMLTGRAAPGRWRAATPDLASRLAAMAHVAIGPPDDALLRAVLSKLFADRQLGVAPDVLEYLIRRMERSFAEAEALAGRLDRLALAEKRPPTRHLAARLFDGEGSGGEQARDGTERASDIQEADIRTADVQKTDVQRG